jgi:hypothetical protein
VKDERRRHPRVARPFEATFSGSSGATGCRIADVSLSGCFVQSYSAPGQGSPTVVTITAGQEVLSLPGRVVYVEPGMGFAVEFQDVPKATAERLERLLASLLEPPGT